MEQVSQIRNWIVKKEVLAHIGFVLIIPLCSLISHTYAPVPPTLILFLIGSLVLIPFLFSDGVNAPLLLVLPIVFLGYLLISQPLVGAPVVRFMGVIFAIGYYLVTLAFGNHLLPERRDSLTVKFILLSVAILIIECIWRYTHPDTSYAKFVGTGDPRWIYQYKMVGIMYTDSNATAIHIIVLLFFVFYREAEGLGKHPVVKWILIFLLVLTLSRAAWFGAVAGWIYFRYLHNASSLFRMVNFALALIVCLIVYIFMVAPRIENDLSFISKFEILNAVVNYAKTATPVQLLFGVGFSNSSLYLTQSAHNFFMIFFVESGIIGLIFMILLLAQFVLSTRNNALIVLIPFIITTLSANITFIPYFYMIMALMVLDRRYPIESDYAH